MVYASDDELDAMGDCGERYSFGDSERDKKARQFARTMEEFMYLTGVSECSDVIPGIEWLDLQGNVKAMKKNAKEMDYFMSVWLEEHVQSKREGKVKKDERDFMDVLLSCFPEDGDGLFGHMSQDIIKGTALESREVGVFLPMVSSAVGVSAIEASVVCLG
ncbi:Cytochrome P450 82A3 [Camellia lanceoleosa]|uniref:Cytochrome P450 82A3 n=1 Tax=Camellia lanceoleosa TaxID=1840588 RepID=A0ACC0HNQ0_9ERIC|nr:Cytochrome P450 82A3 [Camellia lanceoleosa]